MTLSAPRPKNPHRETRFGDFAFRFPARSDLDQDQEWCEALIDDRWRRLRFHDYAEIYSVPGLYEAIFYAALRCRSPRRVVGLMCDVLEDNGASAGRLRALDVGAGNGIVGERLRERGVESVIGVDIIPEAADAARRDRPGVYDDYLVADLCALDDEHSRTLRDAGLNALTTVAALGFGDIPPRAFAGAFRFLNEGGWLGFNLKERFLAGDDDTGFSRLIRAMTDDGVLQMHAYRRYVHRLSVAGEKLHYVAVVARKRREIPTEMLNALDD